MREGATSEGIAFPAVHTTFPVGHTLLVRVFVIVSFPDIWTPLPSPDATLLLTHGVRESVRSAGSGLAEQGSVVLKGKLLTELSRQDLLTERP